MAKTKKLLTAAVFGASACLFGAAISFSVQPVSATSALDNYAQSFAMDKGAKILYDGENTGIRFTALMDSGDYDDLIELNSDTVTVKFGVIVMPYDYVTTGKELTPENIFGANGATKKYCFEDKQTCVCGLTHVSNYESPTLYEDEAKHPGKRIINCSLIDILDDNMPRPFVGVGYVAYEDKTDAENVVTAYKLAQFYNGDVKNNVRSPLYTAQLTYDTVETTQQEIIDDMYFADYVGKNFMYTVNYNVLNKQNEVVKTETMTKYAPFNTKISAPEYDGQDEIFGKLTKVQDDTQYLVYNENKTVIDVNYVNDVKPVITGEIPALIYKGTTQEFAFTATDVYGTELTLTKTLVDAEGNETPVENEYTFDSVGEYTLVLTATDSDGNTTEKTIEFTVDITPEEKYGGMSKVGAIEGTSDIVARIYSGWSADVYDFTNASDATRTYLKNAVPTEQIAGKTPAISYYWEAQNYYSIRLGIQTPLTKADLEGYKEYSGLDTLYFELYMENTNVSTYSRMMKKLTGVNTDGTGVYETVYLTTNQWNTVEYDIDLLIENYETIFYPQGRGSDWLAWQSGSGLVLLATPNKTENNSDWNALDWNNKYYVGEAYISSAEAIDKEAYGGVEKLNAIDSTDDIVARAYWGNYATTYNNFSDEGGFTRAYLKNEVPTEAVGGKSNVVKYYSTFSSYTSMRFGIQPIISKTDLEKYAKYSGLDTLYLEFYNENTSKPTDVKLMKVLTGVNADGTGVYETREFKSGEWHAIEYNVDFLIANYDAIFAPSVAASTYPVAGLTLLAAAHSTEGSDYTMLENVNVCYIGEVYFGKSTQQN